MFVNRLQAGKILGKKIIDELSNYQIADFKKNVVILAIPRGGVVVGKGAAQVLECSLDVIVVKKLGAPGQSELAIGAVGETQGSVYLNKKLVKDLGVGEKYIEEIKKSRNLEIRRREELYRKGREPLSLKNKVVIIVDDGAATGATVIAAARETWNNNPKKVIIGLPVLAKDTLRKLEKEADEVIFLEASRMFFAVGQFYEEFDQVSDEEVVEILGKQ